MILSVNWLKNFLPQLEIGDPENFKHRLDTRLSEVERIEAKGAELANLVVAEILEVKEHPSNKKLTVCRVSDGDGEHEVVCGAPNVKVGLKTVYCRPGGKVYHPATDSYMDIGAKQMGDVKSAGMLCAPDELGLNSDHSKIIELPESTPVGSPVSEMLKDVVIEIENKALPHRPDAFSHLGIARELAAILKLGLRNEQQNVDLMVSVDELLPLNVKIEAAEQCTRFSAIALSNINVGPSPLWLQVALSRADVRPINNVVDVTNYVMLSLGQPMHAFDYDKVGGNLVVRAAKPEEKITTLDGKERELDSSIVVVANNEKAESIAGIMGGAASEITEETKNIVLEAAGWEMYNIRRSSRKLGLRSEASLRYEKGMTNQDTVVALKAAVQLLKDLAEAEVASQMSDEITQQEPDVNIVLDLHGVRKFLGTDIDKQSIVEILNALNIEAEWSKISNDSLAREDVSSLVSVKIPYYRRDLRIAQDLYEEIGRIYGYENIPSTLPKRDLQPPKVNEVWDKKIEIKQILAGAGATEVYTYSMVSPELYKQSLLPHAQLVHIPNPISPELGLVRDRIIPSLLGKLKVNLQKLDRFSIFEISKVVDQLRTEPGEDLPRQPEHLAIAAVEATPAAALARIHYLFSQLDERCWQLHPMITDQTGDRPGYLHPGVWGSVEVAKKIVGKVGLLHPLVQENFNLIGSSVAVLEIELDELWSALPQWQSRFAPVSDFQAVKRDLSLWDSERVPVGELIEKLRQLDMPELDSLSVIDTYKDSKSDKYSYTFRFVLQTLDRTLTTEEINAAMQKITEVAAGLGFSARE